MKIKLIACDVDGTLLGKKLVLSGRLKSVVKEAGERGVAFCIATGRMFSSALPFAQELGLSTPLIAYNGALVKNAATHELYDANPLDIEVAGEILALCEKKGWYIQKYLNDRLYVAEVTEAGRAYAVRTNVEINPEGGAFYRLATAPHKLMMIAEPEESLLIKKELAEVFGERLAITSSNPRFIELVQPGVNKGTALAHLAAKLSLRPAEIMAIGDAHNDLEMVKFAGIGVAVANAAPELKEAARFVSAACEEDGAALAIEKFVLH